MTTTHATSRRTRSAGPDPIDALFDALGVVPTPVHAPSRRRRGYSLLEGILGLAILASVTLGGIRWLTQGINEETARGQATRWVSLTRAADNYLKAEDGVIRAVLKDPAQSTGALFVPIVGANATTSKGSVAALPDFRTAGVLGPDVMDVNRERSSTGMLVYLPAGGVDYEAFLVGYGGSRITDDTLTRAEGMSESRIGAFLNNLPGTTGPDTSVRGVKGGWLVDAASLNVQAAAASQSASTFSPGHFVSYVTMEKKGLSDAGRYLARSKDPNPENNTMRTDILMAGNGLDGVDHICGAVTSGVENNACDGTRLLKIGGDVSTNGGIYATGEIHSDKAMVAPVYYQGDTNGQAQQTQYNLQPAATSTLKNLHTDWLDANTYVYTGPTDGGVAGHTSLPGQPGPSGTNNPSSVRLADLLPREVVKASYVAYDNNVVPKQDCHDGLGLNSPKLKIFASFQRIYNRSSPGVATSIDLPRTPVTVVTGLTGGSSCDQFSCTSSITPTYGIVHDVETNPTMTTQVTSSAQWDEVTAIDQGNSWLIRMPSMAEQPSGDVNNQTMTPQPVDGADTSNPQTEPYRTAENDGTLQNKAIIQVACSYQ